MVWMHVLGPSVFVSSLARVWMWRQCPPRSASFLSVRLLNLGVACRSCTQSGGDAWASQGTCLILPPSWCPGCPSSADLSRRPSWHRTNVVRCGHNRCHEQSGQCSSLGNCRPMVCWLVQRRPLGSRCPVAILLKTDSPSKPTDGKGSKTRAPGMTGREPATPPSATNKSRLTTNDAAGTAQTGLVSFLVQVPVPRPSTSLKCHDRTAGCTHRHQRLQMWPCWEWSAPC